VQTIHSNFIQTGLPLRGPMEASLDVLGTIIVYPQGCQIFPLDTGLVGVCPLRLLETELAVVIGCPRANVRKGSRFHASPIAAHRAKDHIRAEGESPSNGNAGGKHDD